MQESTFWESLAKIARSYPFELRANGFIRQVGTGRCPVSAVATVALKRPFDPAHYAGPALEMGLAQEVASRIEAAADDMKHPLRQKLLVTCGL